MPTIMKTKATANKEIVTTLSLENLLLPNLISETMNSELLADSIMTDNIETSFSTLFPETTQLL